MGARQGCTYTFLHDKLGQSKFLFILVRLFGVVLFPFLIIEPLIPNYCY